MKSKRSTSMKVNWTIAMVLLAVLVFSTVSPAFAAGGTISTISVGAQGTALTYGTAGSASFAVSFTSTGSLSNVVLTVAGLPAGATGVFNPAKLSFTGAQTKPSTLTISITSTAAAVSNRPFTVGYKSAGKAGVVTGSGSLTIGKALLGVQPPLVQDKLYDGTTNAVLNPGCSDVVTTNCAALTGVVTGDVVYLVTTNAHGAFVSANSGAEDANVTGLSLSGAAAGNYAVPANVSTSATINAAPLTITANPGFKTAGYPDPVFSATYNGFVNGETQAVLAALPSCGVAVPHDVEGSYPITCTGASAANYTISYAVGMLTVSSANAVPTDISLSNASVGERLAAGAVVGGLTTADADSSKGEVYGYSLVDTLACPGPDNASFSIPTYTSAGPVPLETAASFHYVTKSSYTVCVEVNDGNGGLRDKQFVVSVLPSKISLPSVANYDGWVLESGQTTNMGGSMNSSNVTLMVGDDKANKQYRSILSFGTGILGRNATIYGITIKVRKAQLTNANLFTMLGGLKIDVNKPAFGKLALQLTDFQQLTAAPIETNVCAIGAVADSNGWYSSVNCSRALPYINKLGPTQFRLHFGKGDNNNNIANYLAFYSGNAGPLSQPQLIITYSVP